MYRVGFPFWKTAARRGIPVSLRVRIRRDKEAGVYVGTSPDLDGLVVEAESLDLLRAETLAVVEELLEHAVNVKHPKAMADFRLLDAAAPCAA